MLSGKVLCLKSRADLLACIAGIPFVHDVAEGSKLVIPLERINVIVQRDQASVILTEDFHISAYLQVIPSEAGHILNDAGLNVSFPHLINHGLKARAIKPSAGDPIIGEMPEHGHAV